jgi:hypothetical protein
MPTVPSDQGCSVIQATVSSPSLRSAMWGTNSPSERWVPRQSCTTTA